MTNSLYFTGNLAFPAGLIRTDLSMNVVNKYWLLPFVLSDLHQSLVQTPMFAL